VDDTDFWSLGTARGWRGVCFVASQEIIQINLNLRAKPRNKRAILGSKNLFNLVNHPEGVDN